MLGSMMVTFWKPHGSLPGHALAPVVFMILSFRSFWDSFEMMCHRAENELEAAGRVGTFAVEDHPVLRRKTGCSVQSVVQQPVIVLSCGLPKPLLPGDFNIHLHQKEKLQTR